MPVTCIEDLRQLARRRVPRAFFEYAEAGSYAEETLRANRADLSRVHLRQRVLVDVSARDTSTTLLGERVPLPLALAPVALTGLEHGNGEIHACRAAQEAGIPYTLSTMSICSIEDVATAVDKPFWFQLYVMKDRGLVRSLIERAAAARCSALVVTVDLQVLGQRHVDIKNGLTVPPSLKVRNLVNMLSKPRWVLGVLAGKRWNFGNLQGWVKGHDSVASLAQWVGGQFDQTLSWQDIEWIRGIWPGKLILKGLLDLEDARLATKAGASAIVVSNHGGRQLDGAPSSISMLPRIAQAVGQDLEVMFDGGIRSGQDVLRAMALGARACMIGRAYIFGLGAGGQAGVRKAIEILRKELEVSMALTGVDHLSKVGPHILVQ
ncbi:MAG TPA: alpha-hydroxy acid oxidase [Burkholderiaceae bacterium]|nr:alpha-hydroxy acid oxidase [Burkholderiaceae bacterium]HQR71887.1 alpha-hydroxy acid oxidase [Burkholderiaceae bacterium]